MKSKSGGEIQPGGNPPRGKKTAKGNELKPLRKTIRQPAPACASCGQPIARILLGFCVWACFKINLTI